MNKYLVAYYYMDGHEVRHAQQEVYAASEAEAIDEVEKSTGNNFLYFNVDLIKDLTNS